LEYLDGGADRALAEVAEVDGVAAAGARWASASPDAATHARQMPKPSHACARMPRLPREAAILRQR
jgi:hypothetical protein